MNLVETPSTLGTSYPTSKARGLDVFQVGYTAEQEFGRTPNPRVRHQMNSSRRRRTAPRY
jgi:hypothetical protein